MRSAKCWLAAGLLWLAVACPVAAQVAPWFPAFQNSFPPVSSAPLRPLPYSPFTYYDLLYGFAPVYLTAPQPTGHEIIPLGPNGYIYRPTYRPLSTTAGYGPQTPLMATNVSTTITAPNVALAGAAGLETAVAEFAAGHYEAARQSALAVAPGDARLGFAQLLASQASFALGRFKEATDSLRQALAVLPESQWGQILNNYRTYYRSTRYTQHLAVLEQYVAQHAADADAHFLLGYHAGYLGYGPNAAVQFRTALDGAPSDALARRLLERFGGAAATGVNIAAPPPRPETLEPAGPRQF